MANKKFSHVRVRNNGVTFAGEVRKAGKVVPVMTEGLESLPPQTMETLCEIVELTENHYAPLEVGTLQGSEFVPLAISKGDKAVADPVPYEPEMPALPIIEEPAAEEPVLQEA